MQRDEAGTFTALKDLRTRVIGPVLARHNGRVFKETGDGLLAEFASVVDAVNAALDWQQALAGEPGDLSFRIGLNVGDVIASDGDIFGDGVNVAARLEGCAPPGGVCVSRAALDYVQDRERLTIEDLGPLTLKNVQRPVHAYSIARGDGRAAARDPIALPDRPVVAVLPFVNMSSDAEDAYFADGLSEDIITRLSYLPGLSVIARTSSFVFRDHTTPVAEISKQLGARFILEGSVRRSGGRLRITGQLIDGTTSAHLWAQRFDRRAADLFDVQDEITHAIVLALQVTLIDGDRGDPGGTEDFQAWEAFHQGAQAHLLYTQEDNLRARRLYAKAVALDPGFVDARVYHAWTFWQHARSGFSIDAAADFQECRRLLDAMLAEGLQTANVQHLEAAMLMIERQYDAALQVSARAVQMGPARLFGMTPAAIVHAYSGKLQEAADILQGSLRAYPYTPSDTVYNLAWLSGLLGQSDRAIGLAEEYMRRVPDDLFAHTALALAYGFAGEATQAQDTIRAFRKIYPRYTLADFAAHEPFQDQAILDRVLAVLRDAGLSDPPQRGR